MRDGSPSQTAMLVALCRALADEGFTSEPGFSDGVASSLLAPGWVAYHRFAAFFLKHAPSVLREEMEAQLDAIPMRVAAIDAEMEEAVADGCRQVVLLGAGLDTRAFRLK